jgi:hypothetical protein
MIGSPDWYKCGKEADAVQLRLKAEKQKRQARLKQTNSFQRPFMNDECIEEYGSSHPDVEPF